MLWSGAQPVWSGLSRGQLAKTQPLRVIMRSRTSWSSLDEAIVQACPMVNQPTRPRRPSVRSAGVFWSP
eukprot:7959992-Alexandrium_andersonii.AAC.1